MIDFQQEAFDAAFHHRIADLNDEYNWLMAKPVVSYYPIDHGGDTFETMTYYMPTPYGMRLMYHPY